MEAELKFTPISKSYYRGNGANQKLFDMMNAELMKSGWRSDTLNGEVMGAVNRLYWEYINNGNSNACEEIPVSRYDKDGNIVDEEVDYKVSDYYMKLLYLVRYFLTKSGLYKIEAADVVYRVRCIILDGSLDSEKYTPRKINAYDRMIDYVTYYVAKRWDENVEIPDWYKNK